MNTDQAVNKLRDVIRRKHLALATEHSYCAWLRRYCDFIKSLAADLPSEQKLERFLTALAKQDIAASTQNQAFNAVIFFYKEALGTELKNVKALRARQPEQVRRAPSRVDTLQLLAAVQRDAGAATSLAARLLYGCGLRVTEPLNLRIKDVDFAGAQLIIRAAKGAKVMPHELRHAYATHCLNRGTNPKAIQEAMGHKSLETTMAYLHADALSVGSPLDGN